jgi:23S rRNA (cytidine1920-2'-O)/16S rRNA (cytidine1409-2'-O)-methyltransferase
VSKDRLDRVLVQRGHVATRERARRLIMAGLVRLEGQLADKPGTQVAADARIELEGNDNPFVSRGGVKLDGVLDRFGVAVPGAVVLDVGASTGGFSDCVLRRGARTVIAVDVGYGQFAWSLRNDPRVILLERTNIRQLEKEKLPLSPTLAVIDVSFISLRLVLPRVSELLAPGGEIVALVKPQFEVGRGQVGKGGVVRDENLQRQAVEALRSVAEQLGLRCLGEIESPIRGPKGNREFFLHLRAS